MSNLNEDLLPDGAWEVTVEARKRGSIGLFFPYRLKIRAAGFDQAKRFAIDEVDLGGYEPRNVLKAEFLGKWSKEKG